MKRIASIMLVFIMLLSLVGCSAKSNSSYDAGYGGMVSDSVESDKFLDFNSSGISGAGNGSYNDGYSQDTSVSKPTTDPTFEETTQNFKERKIVYSVRTTLQTKQLDEALTLIKTNLSNLGGYIQSEELSNNGSINHKYQSRRVYLELRVPSNKLEEFLTGLENENLYTISLYKDSKDYSEAYYDKEARIANLKIQEMRLLELLETASDIKTMLDIEERLSNIRYNIESLTKELNVIDSKVEYSSVTITLSEVVDYDEVREEPTSFFDRLKEAIGESWEDFVEGCQDFAIWLVYAFPTLLIWAIILCVIVLSVRKHRKKKRAKKEAAQQQTKNDAE